MFSLRTFFVITGFFVSLMLTAQVPLDLSQVKANQISDVQLKQYIDQAVKDGMNEQQIESDLVRRGLPEIEIAALKERIYLIQNRESFSDEGTASIQTNGERNLPNSRAKNPLFENKPFPRIFGSEIFSNANLSFEPDMRMATPKNYVIGPDDQLILTIYGMNVSQQNLKVSPEGNVNVKYAGVIEVNGMTIEAAASVLKSRLSRYYPSLLNGKTKLELSLGDIRSIQVIIIGAVKKPGTYTLPSLANLFNALYMSGGPAENGSFRKIELIRNNKVIQKADLYDFLVKGIQQSNIRLEHNDVIRIPFADLLITLKGQINRPGVFELISNETLHDAINYSGGFKSKAYKGRILGERIENFEKLVLDIPGDSLKSFYVKNGDEFSVDSIINRFQNRVSISGAVFKPGTYALQANMSLKDLVNKAQGLKEDVFSGRALLVRTGSDLAKTYHSLDLNPILNGLSNGISLQKDDSIHIASLFDLKDTSSVQINGSVRKPGTYRYEENLSLKSLILKANGFSENATGTAIEISRRKRDVENKPGSSIVELLTVNTNKDLSDSSSDIKLQPFDIVTIKEDPYYKKQISVKISGEVLMPAVYTLQSREERLSSLITRSGGLLYTANIKGAKLIREKKELVDSSEIKRLLSTLERDSSKNAINQVSKNTAEVAIDLDYILKHQGSDDDITLEEGDELIIPRINNTVSVMGEVFRPLDIMYEKGKGINGYLSNAGGVTRLASKGRTFVVYSNGSSAKTTRILGIFPDYPRIEPGSQIFVPQKPKRQGLDVAKTGILISALSALITGIALIMK